MQDRLASLETKISRMEHQAAQHQQYVTVEGIENSNARALVVKAINVLLTLLQVTLTFCYRIGGVDDGLT